MPALDIATCINETCPWSGKPVQADSLTEHDGKVVGFCSDHYTYRITWSAEDDEHVGLCAEFPSLSWLAPTPARALSGIQRLVRECLAEMQATGETAPEPMADRSYSGKFMVRLPPESHRALAMQAAEQGVSLNRLVSARLANDL